LVDSLSFNVGHLEKNRRVKFSPEFVLNFCIWRVFATFRGASFNTGSLQLNEPCLVVSARR